VLNDRERQVLAHIENHLTRTDPAFVGLFSRLGGGVRVPARSMHAAGAIPCLLLVAGLLLLVGGGVTAMAPVAFAGGVLCLLSLAVAHTTTAGPKPGLGFA
jgi:hypothetical protein